MVCTFCDGHTCSTKYCRVSLRMTVHLTLRCCSTASLVCACLYVLTASPSVGKGTSTPTQPRSLTHALLHPTHTDTHTLSLSLQSIAGGDATQRHWTNVSCAYAAHGHARSRGPLLAAAHQAYRKPAWAATVPLSVATSATPTSSHTPRPPQDSYTEAATRRPRAAQVEPVG